MRASDGRHDAFRHDALEMVRSLGNSLSFALHQLQLNPTVHPSFPLQADRQVTSGVSLFEIPVSDSAKLRCSKFWPSENLPRKLKNERSALRTTEHFRARSWFVRKEQCVFNQRNNLLSSKNVFVKLVVFATESSAAK